MKSLYRSRDIRESPLFCEIRELYEIIKRPGSGQISDATDIVCSPDGRTILFAGTLVEHLEGIPPVRICKLDIESKSLRILTFGPHSDRLPRFSPDGTRIAFLSDREKSGDFQLYFLDPDSSALAGPRVEGWLEYTKWSPSGHQLLLGVAAPGADIAGANGAIASEARSEALPAWIPTIETGDQPNGWRTICLYDVSTTTMTRFSPAGRNVWEADWCGSDRLVMIASASPDEGAWYGTVLEIRKISEATSRIVYVPKAQMGCLAGSPSGEFVAFVEATCSDRGIVAGDLRIVDLRLERTVPIDTQEVAVTHCEWQSPERLLVVGHRGPETVVGICEMRSYRYEILWASRDISAGTRFASAAPLPGDRSACAIVGEGFIRAPEIALVREGQYQCLRSLDLGYTELTPMIASIESITWHAPDGLEIQGWLLQPKGNRPHPTIMYVHGGPVWHWHPSSFTRPRSVVPLLLLRKGFALFLPNPRGSAGRDQAFARHVLGDMGGADTKDLLSGIDSLVKKGIADPARLGVMGISYGGYMSAWLITQDSRFAAAVAVAPVINQVTEHLLSNIPDFVQMFLADSHQNLRGKYFERSPLYYAHKVRTPTLIVCGALDRCTPPEEGQQFHRALREAKVTTVLAKYPLEGHGIHGYPAAIDYAARVVSWFETYMS